MMTRDQNAETSDRFQGSQIPEPAFVDDRGAVPDTVAHALEEYTQNRSMLPEVLAALQVSRLLVPVVALATEDESPLADPAGEPAGEKDSEMATVLVQGGDGRLALLAFTGIEALARWDSGARPVPVATADAARAAVAEGASALVVDIAGPVPVIVEGDDLQGFAQGWTLARLGDRTAWVR